MGWSAKVGLHSSHKRTSLGTTGRHPAPLQIRIKAPLLNSLSVSFINERNRVLPSVSGGRILFLSLYVKGLISCAHVPDYITFAYEIAIQIRCNFATLHLILWLRKSTRSFHAGSFMFASTKATTRSLMPDGITGRLKKPRRLYIQVRGCA